MKATEKSELSKDGTRADLVSRLVNHKKQQQKPMAIEQMLAEDHKLQNKQADSHLQMWKTFEKGKIFVRKWLEDFEEQAAILN